MKEFQKDFFLCSVIFLFSSLPRTSFGIGEGLCFRILKKITPFNWFKKSDLEELKQFYRSAILENDALNLHCNSGLCGPVSLKLKKKIDLKGNLQLAAVDGFRPILIAKKSKHHYFRHTYLIDGKTSTNKIIIDATYLQFFSNEIHNKLPSVFIGSQGELIALFKKYAPYVRIKFESENVKPDHPVKTMEYMYGFSRRGPRVRILVEENTDL